MQYRDPCKIPKTKIVAKKRQPEKKNETRKSYSDFRNVKIKTNKKKIE